MLPPTLDELLPLDHPARFVAEFVDALGRDGWSELGVEIGGDPLGAPAYHPRALLSVWLYGFMTGVRSYLGCSHALAKGGAAQSQASRQSKLSTGIDEPPTLRAGGSWGLFGVA